MNSKEFVMILVCSLILGPAFSIENAAGLEKKTTGSIDGCDFFPLSNIWNVPVDNLPRDLNSDAYISAIGADAGLHADFGSGLWAGSPNH